MAAFFLYKHSQNPLSERILNSISAKLVHFPGVTTNVYSNNDLQLVYTVNKSDKIQIFQYRESGLTFFLQGNILESSRGIEKIDSADEEYSLENQIIKWYLKDGISSCVGLNGIYNLIVWNEKKNLLEIAGDRLGIFQIFYANLGNNQFILTSDIITLKLVPGYTPKISKRGVFDLLYMGVAYENRTILEGVERLLPNASYRVINGELTLLEKFKLPFSKERWGYVTPKLLDELEYYYVQAIKRQLKPRDKIIFFQSGGKDSRIFSHFLKMAGVVPQCITAGENHHGEVLLAKNVSKQLGFPWRRVSVSQNFNFSYASDFLEIDSFSSRIFSLWQMEILEKMLRGFNYVTATFLGDPVFGSTIEKGILEKSNDPASAFINYLNFWRGNLFSDIDLMKLFPQNAKEWIVDYEREAFDLFKSFGDEAYQMVMAYGLRFNDRFKVGAVLRTLSAAFPVRLPCIDNDLMDFAFSLPPSLLHRRLLLDLYLIQRAEHLAAIPLDENSRSYSALVPAFKSELKFKLWYAYVKNVKLPILRFLDPVNATTQFYVSIFSLRDKGFQKLRDSTHASLSCLEGLLDITEAKKLFEEKIPPGMDHIMPGNRIRSLLTAALVAEVFRG